MIRQLSLAALLLPSLAALPARAFSHGTTGDSGKTAGSTCGGCHSGGKAPTSVSIVGPSSLMPRQTATYQVVVVSGASAKVAGFDVATSGGTLAAATGGATDRAFNNEVTHSAPGPITGGMTSFSFTLTAPASAGALTLFADGLSADGDGTVAGDADKTTTLAVTVTAPPMPDMAAPVDLARPFDLAPPPPDLAPPPPDLTPFVDFAGLDLLGIDFRTPPDLMPPTDLAPSPPDLVTSASADLVMPPVGMPDMPDVVSSASPDFSTVKKTLPPEARWGCECSLARRAPDERDTALALLSSSSLLLLLLRRASQRRERRRA